MSTDAPLKSALKSQTRHAGNVGEVKTIAHAAQFCLKSFDHCLVVAEDLGPKEFALIQNQLGRLSLWISNIGVFALDRASIDYRLRDVPDTHRLVKGLIEVLNDKLQKCTSRLEALINLIAATSKAPPQQIETANAQLEVVVQRVADDISLLCQLSNTIRRAGRESQNSKANLFFEIKDAEGNNIEKILEARFLHNLTDKFPGCDEQLRRRLAATILLRRKRILYRRSRRPKAPPTRLPIVPEPEIRHSLGPERSMIPVEARQQETGPAETHTLKREPSMVHSQARTTKTTTTLDPGMLRPPAAPSVLSVARTIPLHAHDDLVFPPPPRAAILELFRELKASRRARHETRLLALPNFELYVTYKGKPPSLPAEDVLTLQAQIQEAERDLQKGIDADLTLCKNTETEVLCPYCLCVLSSTDMKSMGKWRDHLRGDLDAYVCLFQDCENPCELYSHSDTWLKHMRQHAVRWQCMAKSHGPQTFEQREEYERHLREAHEGVFSDSQILAMAERNARMMGPLFQSCPLCGVTKDHPTVTDRLEDHIVGHLRYLALSSLPYIEEEEQKTNSTNSLGSDDSAKPADRSTVHDFLDQEFDLTSEETVVALGPPDVHSDVDPYSAWNGIQNYVRASHTFRPGEPPKQIFKFPSDTFPCPVIPASSDDEEPYLQQCDDSSLFVDAHDITEESPDRRSAQWGWIPTMMIPYEGQEADPILQGFRRRAVSNTLAAESTTSRGTSASTIGSAPVRQQILQRFNSATITPTDMPSFVPMNKLTELIDIETVSITLAEAGRHDLSSELCANIADTLPRVFATLLLIGNIEAIFCFESRGFTDDIFPLLRAETPPVGMELQDLDWDWYTTIHPLNLPDGFDGEPHPVSICFEDPSLWTLDKFERFYDSQWIFSAPVFGQEKFEYLLAPQSPLPLTTLTPHRAGGVFCSQVYMASIHPAHLSGQNTLGTALCEVAVKILKTETDTEKHIRDTEKRIRDIYIALSSMVGSPADAKAPAAQITEDFLVECDVLYAMRTINHAHLLKAIAAFMRGQQCGFIMPRGRGSLRTFWEIQDHSMPGSEKIISWLFTQLLGITDGLTKLHEHHYDDRPSTRHGALTPDNILWFPGHEYDPDTHSLGVLIIGDAGRTLETSKHASGVRGTGLRYTTQERPPSSYDDNWSLGLVCFEFVIWLIRGNREVEEFRSQTSPLYLSDDSTVERWLNLLLTDERCLPQTPLGLLVQFIVRKLLVSRHGRVTASQFYNCILRVRSAVSASGSSYTAVQPELHFLLDIETEPLD